MIENFLEALGLNANERNVYLYLLGHGESIASIIAKRLGIKRPTVYATLESLEQKEFVVSSMENGAKHFDVVDPDEIVELCEKRVTHMQELRRKASVLKKEFDRMRDEGKKLSALGGNSPYPKLEVQGKIKYFEGINAVRDMLEESLEENPPDKMILCFGLNEFHTSISGTDWKKYTQKRVARGLFVKSIQPDIAAALPYKKRDKQELRETRLVPHDAFPGFAEFNVIGDMIALFATRGESPVALKMYNKEMAMVLRSVFALAWEKAAEYNEKLK